MLYDRWCQIVKQYGEDIALTDGATGQRFTFRQLDAQVTGAAEGDSRVIFPQGISSGFILSVLKSWRSGQVVCPLEVGQQEPAVDVQDLPDRFVHLKMTSATGGKTRMVAFTASQLAADAENIVSTMGLRRDSPNIGVISLAHSYGFSNLVLPLLLHGVPLVLVPSPLPETVRRTLETSSNATLAGVPALWRTWHEADVLKNIRLAISAGAPLPLALERAVFASAGIKIHNFYGSTECGGIAYDATETPRADAACVGSRMKNVSVEVGEHGCMEVRGKAVGECYWPEPGDGLRDGVFRTSDLAEIREGVVYLRGRAGDLINVAGRKVSPESIERVLLSNPDVTECLVFGVPSEDERTETVVACVVSQCEKNNDHLRRYLLSRLPAWQIPREWWFVDSLHTNLRGKISRKEWREKFLNSAQRSGHR